MKKCIVYATLLSLICLGSGVQAGPVSDRLGVCLTDALTGKERKQLVKWIFFGFASHPEMASYSNISEEDKSGLSRYVGTLMTRLYVEDCPRLIARVYRDDGMSAVKNAFGSVGKIAVQEILKNQEVQKSLGDYIEFIDTEKLNRVLE